MFSGIPMLAVCNTQWGGFEVALPVTVWKIPDCWHSENHSLSIPGPLSKCHNLGLPVSSMEANWTPLAQVPTLQPTDMPLNLEPQPTYVFIAPLTGTSSIWTITNCNDIKISKQHLPDANKDGTYRILCSPVMLGLFAWFLCPVSCIRELGCQRSHLHFCFLELLKVAHTGEGACLSIEFSVYCVYLGGFM